MTNELVLDIETIPNQSMSEEIIEVGKVKTAKKRGENKDNVDKFAALTPEMGQIVCICVGAKIDNQLKVIELTGEEHTILDRLWRLIGYWDRVNDHNITIVTFNGKSLDIPYILKRSIIQGIRPTVHIPVKKYQTTQHYDVMEVLSGGLLSNAFNLGTYCLFYGISHNRDSHGRQVYDKWKEGNIQGIVEHCVDDVRSTWELYSKIKDVLR